jgi:hypothetical protein
VVNESVSIQHGDVVNPKSSSRDARDTVKGVSKEESWTCYVAEFIKVGFGLPLPQLLYDGTFLLRQVVTESGDPDAAGWVKEIEQLA